MYFKIRFSAASLPVIPLKAPGAQIQPAFSNDLNFEQFFKKLIIKNKIYKQNYNIIMINI